jgi:Tol biopolymer transport system component
MRRRLIRYGLVLTLLSAALVGPERAEAGKRWGKGSQSYFSNDQVCRDGMVVSVGRFNAPPEVTEFAIPIGARLYTNTDLALWPDDSADARNNLIEYGPLLVPPTPVLAVRQDPPLEADTTGGPDGTPDGIPDTTLEVYTTGVTIAWGRVLPLGSTVILFGGSGEIAEPVADCFLNRPQLAEGASTPIDSSLLRYNDGFTDAEALTYQLDTPPAGGTLRLDGVALAAGATFTQADIDANRLSYAHGGGENASDVFTYTLRATTRVSVASDGGEGGSGDAFNPSISADGRYLAFDTARAGLVPTDTNGVGDVFWHDQGTNTTLRASVRANSTQAISRSLNAAITPDGFRVAYESEAQLTLGGSLCGDAFDTNNVKDVYISIFDSSTAAFTDTRALSFGPAPACAPANGAAGKPSVGNLGSPTAFESSATNLVSPIETLGFVDVYRTDGFGNVRRISSDSADGEANAASLNPVVATDSADGREWVAFESTATDIVGGDSNGQSDIFVGDAFTTTRRVSITTGGTQATGGASASPSISYSGRYVAYRSTATNLVGSDSNGAEDIFVRDRDTDGDNIFDEPGNVLTARVSVATGGTQASGPGGFTSNGPALAGGGQFVAFRSTATNLVPDDSNNAYDVFLRDRLNNRTSRVSVASDGSQATGGSYNPSVSADGAYVAFESDAADLVPGDGNGNRDIFVHFVGFTSSFPISITPVNDAPSVGAPAQQTANPGTTVGPLELSIADADNAADSLTLSASSSNQTLLPDGNIELGGSGLTRTITLSVADVPLAATTAVVVTLEVADGERSGSASFELIVQPVGVSEPPARARVPLLVRN